MLKNNILLRKFISIFLIFNFIFICMNISSCSKHNYEYYPELIEYINSSIPKDSDMEIVHSGRNEYSENFMVEIWIINISSLSEISLLFDLYNSYIDNNPDYIESNVKFDLKAKDMGISFACAYADDGGYVDSLRIDDLYYNGNLKLSDFEGLFPTVSYLCVRSPVFWENISEFDVVASMPNLHTLNLPHLLLNGCNVNEILSEFSERYPELLVILTENDKTYYSNPTLAEEYGY